MRHWIRTAVIGTVMAAAMGPESAVGLDSVSVALENEIGECSVIRSINPDAINFDTAAAVYLSVPPPQIITVTTIYAGVSIWIRGVPPGGLTPSFESVTLTGPSVTAEQLATCLGAPVEDITNLTQKGADADSFEDQESMGFGFTLTKPAGGLAATHHQYYIGTVPSPPATTPHAPTDLVATAGDGQVSIAFTAPSNGGGPAISDYEYELDDSGTWISASTATSPVVITGLTNGTAYYIKLRAVNSEGDGAESAAVSVLLGSPASEFAAKEDAIRSVITDDAQRSLNSTLASNTRLTRDARERFLTSRAQMQSDGAGLASRNT